MLITPRDLRIVSNSKRVKKEQYYNSFSRKKLDDYILNYHKDIYNVVNEIFMNNSS